MQQEAQSGLSIELWGIGPSSYLTMAFKPHLLMFALRSAQHPFCNFISPTFSVTDFLFILVLEISLCCLCNWEYVLKNFFHFSNTDHVKVFWAVSRYMFICAQASILTLNLIATVLFFFSFFFFKPGISRIVMAYDWQIRSTIRMVI